MRNMSLYILKNKCENEEAYLTLWFKPETVLPPHTPSNYLFPLTYKYWCQAKWLPFITILNVKWYGFTCNFVSFQLLLNIHQSQFSYLWKGANDTYSICHLCCHPKDDMRSCDALCNLWNTTLILIL